MQLPDLINLHTTYWLGLRFHFPCLETATSLKLSIPTSCRIAQYFVCTLHPRICVRCWILTSMYDTDTDASQVTRAIGPGRITGCPIYRLTMIARSTLTMLSTYSRRCRDSNLFCLVQESSLHSRLSERVGNVVGPLASHVVREGRQ
jgi:hypothetical protein